MIQHRFLRDVIKEINGVLYHTNMGQLDPFELQGALEYDCGARGSVPPSLSMPTQEEAYLLACAVDSAIYIDLEDRFPKTIALVRSLKR